MANYLIIGASSGMGREVASQLHEEGHEVYATYCNHELQFESNRFHCQYLNVLSDSFSLDFLPECIDGLIYCPGTISLKP